MNIAAMTALEIGRAYWITYTCRDIGYGVEGVRLRGQHDDWGKHKFDPVGGGDAIYLFPDEITDVD